MSVQTTDQILAGPLDRAAVIMLGERDPHHRYELSEEGVVTITPLRMRRHRQVALMITSWLVRYLGPELIDPEGGLFAGSRATTIPDIMILKAPVPGDSVWNEATAVRVVIEIESPGTWGDDRVAKPREYARAGIPTYWRISFDDQPQEDGTDRATVHIHHLGAHGHYEETEAIDLAVMLAGEPDLHL